MPGRVQLDGGSLQFHSGVEHLGGGEIQGVLRRAEAAGSANRLKQGEKAC